MALNRRKNRPAVIVSTRNANSTMNQFRLARLVALVTRGRRIQGGQTKNRDRVCCKLGSAVVEWGGLGQLDGAAAASLAAAQTMARKLRVEYAGACYHVINRGNYRSHSFAVRGDESFQRCNKVAVRTLWHDPFRQPRSLGRRATPCLLYRDTSLSFPSDTHAGAAPHLDRSCIWSTRVPCPAPTLRPPHGRCDQDTGSRRPTTGR
jgi:hypothetical protein